MKGVLIAIALVLTSFGAAQNRVWYGGDLNESEYIIAQQGVSAGLAMVYEDFEWTSAMPLSFVEGSFTSSFAPTQGYYEIRSGMSAGDGGTLLASGLVSAVSSVLSGGTSSGPNYLVQSVVPALNLVLGQRYFVGYVPYSVTSGYESGLGLTSGQNAVGTPGLNGTAYFFGQGAFDYVPLNTLFTNANASLGVGTVVPEPATLVGVGLGLVALARRRS